MAKETACSVFQGTDRNYVFTILNVAETAAINISGWALSWMVKKKRSDADASALLTKTTASAIVISGSFNSDPDENTQIATVSIEDTDTTSLDPGTRYWELKRTDAGFETVLGYGALRLIRGVHR